MLNKRILFTNLFGDLGGGELCLLNHIGQTKSHSDYISVILLQNGELVSKLKQRNIKVHIVKWSNLTRVQNIFYSTLAILRILYILKREKINLVISYCFADLILSGIACKILNIPIVFRSQGGAEHFEHKRKWMGKLIRFFYNSFVERIISITYFDRKKMILNGVKEEKICVVPWGVEIGRFNYIKSGNKIRGEFNISSGAPLIGFAGRLVPWKGHKTFLEALAKVKKEVPDIKALIAGDAILNDNNPEGYKKELLRLTEDLCLKNNVIFTGFRADMPEFMQEIDIFVHASHKEPFGMVIVEAMAAGKPVVASRVSGPLEIVRDGETGLLVEPQDADGLAKSILYLIKNQNLAKLMGQKGRERVKELFDLEKNISEIDRYCEILMAKGGKN